MKLREPSFNLPWRDRALLCDAHDSARVTLRRATLPMASPPVGDASERLDSPSPPTASREPAARTLNAELVRAVLRFVGGDVATLCAAACVATAWHTASRECSLWRNPVLSPRVKDALSDKSLVALAARAGADGLSTLDLTGCRNVTVCGVSSALLPYAPLEKLRVRGVWVPTGSDVGDDLSFASIHALQRCVRTPDGLDVDIGRFNYDKCAAYVGQWKYSPLCNRLCSLDDRVCDTCNIFMCDARYSAAENNRDTPCDHICSSCFEQSEDCSLCSRCANGDGWLGKLRRGRQARFCSGCLAVCTRCRDSMCKDCNSDEYYKMRSCDCGKVICRSCDESSRGCVSCMSDGLPTCRKVFCSDCVSAGRLKRYDWVEVEEDDRIGCMGILCADCARKLLEEDPVRPVIEVEESRVPARR